MDIQLGIYLKNIRKELNLTLRDVEAAIGLSNAYLSQIENNKILKPSPNILYQIASFYRISYEKLMYLADYPTLNHSNKIINKIDQSFSELTDNEKEEVFDFINYLKSKRDKQ